MYGYDDYEEDQYGYMIVEEDYYFEEDFVYTTELTGDRSL